MLLELPCSLMIYMRLISVLVFSFNLLRSLPECLQHFSSLRTVYFVQNKMTKMHGMQNVSNTLRSLELGGNRIRVNPFVC